MTTTDLNFGTVFTYAYFTMLILICLISLAMPLQRAMCYITTIAIIFSALTMISFVGMVAFLLHTGFYPEVKYWDQNPDGKWAWISYSPP
jgi:hypothetical protein